MQRPRTLLRRLLVVRPSRASTAARPFTFTRNANLAATRRGTTRPQVPYLAVPLARNQQFRYLTTERRRWLAYEVVLGIKYTLYVWAIAGIAVAGFYSVQQEWLERRYPTPHEWALLTRLRLRLARWVPDRPDLPETDWVLVGNYASNVVARLEDPNVDGAELRLGPGGGPGYDVTAKSEPWRRGYHEALMLCAKAAENLDDQVVDTTRRLVFPADQVVGPSNPSPKPIAHGSQTAPLEHDCERAFEPPDGLYQKILGTAGFSPKQKLDAALQYASWLDFKGTSDAAYLTYEWALSLALATENSSSSSPSSSQTAPPPYDPQSFVLHDTARQPSANLLATLTALATHKARNGDVAAALPILLSVLRARRSLPQPPPAAQPLYSEPSIEAPHPSSSPWTLRNVFGAAKRLAAPPPYPPPPDDGGRPPVRDARELCEEAGLNLYVGEIMYAAAASSSSRSGREDGLAWTREAVDLAEEQLHRLNNGDGSPATDFGEAKATCRECLASGLDNWRLMVAQLAREEAENQAAGASGSSGSSNWLAGLWGDGKPEDTRGRWAAEENVVRDRMRRAQDVMEESETPNAGFWSLFWA
ncbi:hypothetical protein GGR52DRAFT_484774 [Hypoxylon sp. FL1284]|nr:hypothetical protein GGR52DRAFT_484774 [Hypoxylon sp. FL1284]